MGAVETYLDALVSHDWDALAGVVTDDVVRVGPFFDAYEGRDKYVSFLSELMPSLQNYAMDVTRITYTDDGRHAFAELAETMDFQGASLRTPEVLTFDLTDGRIARIDVFIQRKL